jgi:hypothetical protein
VYSGLAVGISQYPAAFAAVQFLNGTVPPLVSPTPPREISENTAVVDLNVSTGLRASFVFR